MFATVKTLCYKTPLYKSRPCSCYHEKQKKNPSANLKARTVATDIESVMTACIGNTLMLR